MSDSMIETRRAELRGWCEDVRSRSATWAAVALGTLLSLSAPAGAQFFDDFNGSALGAHWQQPPSNQWVHEVSGGMLHVIRLLAPSQPPQANVAQISTVFNPVVGDFEALARVSWEPETVLSMAFALTATPLPGGSTSIAQVTVGTINNTIYLYGGSGPPTLVPGPRPGAHDFLIRRTGNTFSYYLDGILLETRQDNDGLGVGQVILAFVEPFPFLSPQPVPFRIDAISVVPAPNTLALFGVALLGLTSRRRRP